MDWSGASAFRASASMRLGASSLHLGPQLVRRRHRGFLGAEILEQDAAVREIVLGQAVARPGGTLATGVLTRTASPSTINGARW